MTATDRLLLLGSAVLTAEGRYEYRVIPQRDAVELVRAHSDTVASSIGHASTAARLTELVGVQIAANRCSVTQRVGETALVVRPIPRASQAREHEPHELAAHSLEWGLLERIE